MPFYKKIGGMSGKKHSEETKKKMSLALKNRVFSEEHKAKLSTAQTGKRHTDETKEKISRGHKGREFSLDHRKKIGEAHKKEKCYFWKGGVSSENAKIRSSMQYKVWRKKVFERDDYTCQSCNQRGGILNADHIKPFSLFPELRFEINNGRTLCKECHEKTNTFAGRIHKMKG